MAAGRPTWTLTLLLLASWCSCLDSFPADLQPISVVEREQSRHYAAFRAALDNHTLTLDFQAMLRVNHVLFITARDQVFAVNLSTAAENFIPQLTLTWRSKDVSKCAVRGKNSDECFNYVKVLVARDDETLFACGTNAFNPTCRNYKMTTLEQVGPDLVGQARCPFESGQSIAGLFAGGDFYSATMTDFLASDAVIYRSLGDGRPVLRTVKYDSKWLREPHFLHAIDYGSYVYFFLREIAVEYTTLGKVVFSRVARVCKNDNGGSPRVLDKYWTSFLKARLNCSVPGDSFFYFDALQSITNVLQINGRPTVVGVFTTQANSIPGSAVCAFYMDDIEKVFNGRFKEQRNSDSSWTPVPDEQVPKPRPGSCAGDGPAADFKSSVQFPDETLMFIKSYPLMDEAVPSVNHRPFFTRTSDRFKLTQIVVDVAAGPNKDWTVMFLGSDEGRVLKVLTGMLPNDTIGSKLLEDIDAYDPSRCDIQDQQDRKVLGLELDKDHHALFVAFSSCVIRVPLSRCSRHGACKKACLSSHDPYCIWLRTGSCTNMAPGFKAGFEQDIGGDHSTAAGCNADILENSRDQESPADSAYGVQRLPDVDQHSAAHVHYTLLLACALLAFFLGAILSAFLASCYCDRSSNHRKRKLSKDPEVALPPALSLHSLAKLNSLLDGQHEDEKTDMSTCPKAYTSFIPGAGTESHLFIAAHHNLPLGEARLSLCQEDGEMSGLPTPDASPEFPKPMSKDGRQHPYEATDAIEAVSGKSQPTFPLSRRHGNSRSEDHKVWRDERATGDFHHCHESCTPAPVNVSALDELLKHIQEVSASGSGGIKVLTSASSSSAEHHHRQGNQHHDSGQHHLQGIPKTEPTSYPGAPTLLWERPDMPSPNSAKAAAGIPSSRVILEMPAHLQRHALIKMGSGLPRHHSFNQRAAPPFLARMNTNSSSNGPPAASACLTRQHSYSEGPHARRAAIVRRTVSLKPKVPPKPLFLPNVATSALYEAPKDHY
ncbi:semaphorin-6D-like [Entelurus aequoreus]|uniref:semaphorin-6D-like n=1 Tax=Entelurus aequoreus TaxID=161455 RepID=UPI002B1DAD6F|nr:semaphorin-6D-like [Entelurus aequoreus]